MSIYLGMWFNKSAHSTVFAMLQKFDYPIACFVSSLEEFACIKETGCYNCGYLVTDLTLPDENNQEMYCFVEADKELCKDMYLQLVDMDGMEMVFCMESLDKFFAKHVKLLCIDCKKVLSTPNATTSISTTSSESRPIKLEELNAPSTSMPLEIKEIKPEENEEPVGTIQNAIQDKHDEGNSTVHYQGDFSTLCNSNPEYQWTKCKICMRILRTKRCDASRMRTLQTSHARNHVTRFQYACKLCTFGCRFHGGIQLHMTRMHPGLEAAYVDRSKESRYRDEIAKMVVTCFGTEIRSTRGTRSEMYRLDA